MSITKTCLYNSDPLEPDFYTIYSETGIYTGIHYFFYFAKKKNIYIYIYRFIATDKRGYPHNIFLISPLKHVVVL